MSINVNGFSSANSETYQRLHKRSDAEPQAEDKAAASSIQSNNADSFSATGKSNYWNYLSENYDCVKNGKVSISPAYLRACAENPEKAKALEEELSSYNECYNTVLNNIKKEGDTVKSFDLRYEIDSNGEVTVKGSVTVEASIGGKSMKELQEELEEKKTEKKEQEELEAEKSLQDKIEKEFIENTGKDDFNFNISINVQTAEIGNSASASAASGSPNRAVDTVA